MSTENKSYSEEGKFVINDSKVFISMLHGDTEENSQYYKLLTDFAFKQKPKLAPEIPPYDYQNVVNFAIVKAINGFSAEKGAKLQSYFWEKLRGEISAYRSKQHSLQKKVIAMIEEGEQNGIEYAYQKGAGANGEENYLEAIDMESTEDKIVKEDKYRRQIKAFKMAFSGIPREIQVILNEIAKGKNIAVIASILGMDSTEVSQKRNYGLSLILQRVMRSKHISDDEKIEVAELHGFDYDPKDFEATLGQEDIRE